MKFERPPMNICQIKLPILSLFTAASALGACTTDEVAVETLQVSAPAVAAQGTLASFTVSLADNIGEAEVHLNGLPLSDGANDIIRIQNESTFAFSVAPGSYVLELIAADGDVLVQTAPMQTDANHLTAVIAYRDGVGLSYHAQTDDWDGVTSGMVQANFSNVTTRGVSGDLNLCRFEGETKSCELLVANLAYGERWSGEAPAGSRFEFDVAGEPQVEFWSPEFGEEAPTPSRIINYAPLDWIDFDDTDCPGCTSSLESSDSPFRE